MNDFYTFRLRKYFGHSLNLFEIDIPLSVLTFLPLLPNMYIVGHEVQAAQGAGQVSGSSRNSNSGGQARSSHRAMSQVYLQEEISLTQFFFGPDSK